MKRLKTLTLAILLVAFASVALLGCGLFQWWDNGNNNGNGNNGYYNGYCNDNEAIDVPVHTVTARGAMTAYVNEYVSFMATVLPSNATNREVTWVVVGDGAGATISSDGVFRASTEGVFTVVATAGGVSGSTLITVVFSGYEPTPSKGFRLGAVPIGAHLQNEVDVTVNGESMQLHRVWTSNHQHWRTELWPTRTSTPVGYIYASKNVEIEIDFRTPLNTNTIIRPIERGIAPTIVGTRVRFTTAGHGTYIIEPNGDHTRAVFLFVDPYHCNRAPVSTQNVIRFEAGLWTHENHDSINPSILNGALRGMVNIPSNTTVIIEEGAVVRAGFVGADVTNVRIAGRGVIDGSTFLRTYHNPGPFTNTIPISFYRSSNIIIEDVAIHDPAGWVVHSFFVNDMVIDGMRFFTSRMNGDGISLQSNQRVTVRNTFGRAWDDAFVVKNYPLRTNAPQSQWGATRDILFENLEVWSDFAQALEVGYELVGEVAERITFRDITVFHAFHRAVISINNGNNANIRDVLFENITIENAQMGLGDASNDGGILINIRHIQGQWSNNHIHAGTPMGQIDGVVVRNINIIESRHEQLMMRFGGFIDHLRGGSRHYVRNVEIYNIFFKGERADLINSQIIHHGPLEKITLEGECVFSSPPSERVYAVGEFPRIIGAAGSEYAYLGGVSIARTGANANKRFLVIEMRGLTNLANLNMVRLEFQGAEGLPVNVPGEHPQLQIRWFVFHPMLVDSVWNPMPDLTMSYQYFIIDLSNSGIHYEFWTIHIHSNGTGGANNISLRNVFLTSIFDASDWGDSIY